MRLHVGAHAVAPRIGADIVLQHPDHRLALLVGDAVEGHRGLFHRLDVLHHRVRGGDGFARHGLFAAATDSSSECHSGCRRAVVRPSIHEAKPSLSHRSSHQRIVTRSPNHWCAISCATTRKATSLSRWVEMAGSSSIAPSKVKIEPQFSIAEKNWLRPGAAMLSSFGSGYLTPK